MLLALAVASVTPPGRAQEADKALSAGHAGLERYQAGDWNEALALFRAADRLAHSPVFTLYMARCERNLGRLLAARVLLLRLADENVSPDAPTAWRRALDDARRDLAELNAKIPSITLRIEGAAGPARVTLDGRVLGSEEQRDPISLDPGEHVIEVEASGRRRRERVRVVEGGGTLAVVLTLVGPSNETGPSPQPAAPKAVSPARERPAEGPPVAPWVALGIGALGVAAGSVLGVVAASRTSGFEDRCRGDRCLASDADEGAAAKRFADASTIAFVIGGVGLGTGVVLLLAGGEKEHASPKGAMVGTALRF